MSTFRTLNERPELFRTPRTRKEAGIGNVPIHEDVEFLTQGFAAMVSAAVLMLLGCLAGAAALGGFLVLVLGWTT